MYKIFKEFDTGGQPIFEYPLFLGCDCSLTGGCFKCRPFYPFWEEDIKLAEEDMDEYEKILKEEDNK